MPLIPSILTLFGTKLLGEIRDVKETTKEALLMIQAGYENTSPLYHANDNYITTNKDDWTSEILTFLKKLQEEVQA